MILKKFLSQHIQLNANTIQKESGLLVIRVKTEESLKLDPIAMLMPLTIEHDVVLKSILDELKDPTERSKLENKRDELTMTLRVSNTFEERYGESQDAGLPLITTDLKQKFYAGFQEKLGAELVGIDAININVVFVSDLPANAFEIVFANQCKAIVATKLPQPAWKIYVSDDVIAPLKREVGILEAGFNFYNLSEKTLEQDCYSEILAKLPAQIRLIQSQEHSQTISLRAEFKQYQVTACWHETAQAFVLTLSTKNSAETYTLALQPIGLSGTVFRVNTHNIEVIQPKATNPVLSMNRFNDQNAVIAENQGDDPVEDTYCSSDPVNVAQEQQPAEPARSRGLLNLLEQDEEAQVEDESDTDLNIAVASTPINDENETDLAIAAKTTSETALRLALHELHVPVTSRDKSGITNVGPIYLNQNGNITNFESHAISVCFNANAIEITTSKGEIHTINTNNYEYWAEETNAIFNSLGINSVAVKLAEDSLAALGLFATFEFDSQQAVIEIDSNNQANTFGRSAIAQLEQTAQLSYQRNGLTKQLTEYLVSRRAAVFSKQDEGTFTVKNIGNAPILSNNGNGLSTLAPDYPLVIEKGNKLTFGCFCFDLI